MNSFQLEGALLLDCELHGNFTTISGPGIRGVNVRRCQPDHHLRVAHRCPVSPWPRASSSMRLSPIRIWRLRTFCLPRGGVHLAPQLYWSLAKAWLVFQRLCLCRPFLQVPPFIPLEIAGSVLAMLTFDTLGKRIHPTFQLFCFQLKDILLLHLSNTKEKTKSDHCIAKVVSVTKLYLDVQI